MGCRYAIAIWPENSTLWLVNLAAAEYCPYGLTHVRVPIFGNKKGDITSLNQLGILGELFSEFAFALHIEDEVA